MVLWRNAYKKRLLARANVMKYKYQINTNEVLIKKSE